MGEKEEYILWNRITFNFRYSINLHTALCMQKALIDSKKYVNRPQILIVHFFESNVYKHCL